MTLSEWKCPVILNVQDTEGSTKTRNFSATLLSYVTLAEPVYKDPHFYPDLMAFGGSEYELKAFVANLKLGRMVTLPKAYRWQSKVDGLKMDKDMASHAIKTATGSVWICYRESLFTWGPSGVDPDGVNCVILPSEKWVKSHPFSDDQVDTIRQNLISVLDRVYGKVSLGYNSSDFLTSIHAEDDTALRKYIVYGALLLGQLDRRSRIPIPFDIGLGVYIYWSLHQYDRVTYLTNGTSKCQGLPLIGLTDGFRVDISHRDLSTVVSRCVMEWRLRG